MSIETRDLTMVYQSRRGGQIVAVESLDLSIRPGEVFGLLGPNGAGKTTTIRMLCGLIRPTRGTVQIDGIALSDHPQKVRRPQSRGRRAHGCDGHSRRSIWGSSRSS